MRKKILTLFSLSALFFSLPVQAFAITPEEIAAAGKETVTGNLLIWFLCAIAFLKISQKIDSFMSSLGVNVGNTGGSMLAELMIAARGISAVKNISSGGSFHGGSSSHNSSSASFLSGGLAGAVGRHITNNAIQNATGHSGHAISGKVFESSMQKGGDFANSVIGAVAQGNINYTGSMTGPQASQALSSYMGETGKTNAPSYDNVEIGGGRITGTETSISHPDGEAFAMYNAEQYMAPDGHYDTITAADNSTWYRQYATDAVERTPYMTGEGKIAYHEDIVKKLPHMPARKDHV